MFWHSLITVSDTSSGIRSIKVTSPGSRSINHITNEIVQYPSNIGSIHAVNVWLEISCCYNGVEITTTNLRGQISKCVAGVNPNEANSLIWSNMLINILSIYAILYGQQKWENAIYLYSTQCQHRLEIS